MVFFSIIISSCIGGFIMDLKTKIKCKIQDAFQHECPLEEEEKCPFFEIPSYDLISICWIDGIFN